MSCQIPDSSGLGSPAGTTRDGPNGEPPPAWHQGGPRSGDAERTLAATRWTAGVAAYLEHFGGSYVNEYVCDDHVMRENGMADVMAEGRMTLG